MQNHKKIALAILKNFKADELVRTRDIINVVQKEFPEVPRGSIIPYDYCINHENRDPSSGKYHIFKKNLAIKGIYKVLDHSVIKKSCLNK